MMSRDAKEDRHSTAQYVRAVIYISYICSHLARQSSCFVLDIDVNMVRNLSVKYTAIDNGYTS
jgi:hypothetical protein